MTQQPPTTASPDFCRRQPAVGLRFGSVRWRVNPDVADLFFDENGLRLEQWQREKRVETIKTGSHRTVFRLALPDGHFILKHYRIADAQALAQNLVRPSKAELECNAARQIAACGIDTFEPLAFGEDVRLGIVRDSYLISREIKNAKTVQDFVQADLEALPSASQSPVRQALARELGRLTAKLHRHGWIHRDFHAGNLLLRWDADFSLNLWLIDLHAVSRRRTLSLKQIERNLSLLNHFFSRYATRSDRLRFFQAWWETVNEPPLPAALPRSLSKKHRFRAICRRFEFFCEAAKQEAFRKGDRKWERGNRRLIIADTGRTQCRGLAALGRRQLESIRDNPECLLSATDRRGGMQQTPATQSACVSIELNGRPTTASVTKTVHDRPAPDFRWKKGWSAARRAWELGHALSRRGIPTPCPILFVETPENGRTSEYLVTEAVPDAVSLAERIRELAAPGRADSELDPIIDTLADAVRRLHGWGYDHPALNGKNILVAPGVPDSRGASSYGIWLTEIDRIRAEKRLTTEQISSSLASLLQSLKLSTGVPLTAQLRFLKRYLRQRFSEEWKALWRAVARQQDPPAKKAAA